MALPSSTSSTIGQSISLNSVDMDATTGNAGLLSTINRGGLSNT